MSPRTVAVIGAGVGGIAAATHLARRGLHVVVYEKNDHPGGRLDRFERDGHFFDTGPTLLVLPLVYRAEFERLGASLDDELELRRVDPTYHLVFDDDRRLALTSDAGEMRRQLESIEPGSYDGYRRYLNEGAVSYHTAMELLVDRQPDLIGDLLSPRSLALLRLARLFLPHYARMGAYFDDPRLKAAFTFQDIYMGLSPFEAPTLFSFVPFSELAHGVWYPAGGMYRIVEALMGIARRSGVEFAFSAPVARIEVGGGAARQVVLADGTHHPVDAVLANADLPYVYHDLLPRGPEAERLAHKRFSCSVVSFFWGVDRVIEPLGPHTLFVSRDVHENFDAIDQRHALPDDPSLYLHAPARLDASLAPPGQDTLTAIVPVGHIDPSAPQDWSQVRDRARAAVLRRMARFGIEDFESHIKFEVGYAPPAWRRRYNLMKGATHGLSHTLGQMGYFRPQNRHARYRNVYFVGASTHPGTGVPTALISARLTAQRLLEEL